MELILKGKTLIFIEESVKDAKAQALNPGRDYVGKGYEAILCIPTTTLEKQLF